MAASKKKEPLKRGRGRPKGSRNKSSLLKAQLKLDEAAELATTTLMALMLNQKDALQLDKDEDVPLSIRRDAAKYLLDKSIANEKEKEKVAQKDTDTFDDEEEDLAPVVSLTAIKRD